MLFKLFGIFVLISEIYGAAILPLSQQIAHEENITDALTGEMRRAPGSGNGMDLETFTKNAAIRTNQENAILQQLAFRRNTMLTTRDAPNFNNTIASQVADSDLFNALLHPSSAGHSSQNFGNQNFAGLPPWEKDRLLLELMEQNRRQQLEIQRLVQQNMIRQGRPVMPFMEEDGGNLPSPTNFNNNNNLRGQIGQIPSNFVDLNKQRNEFLNGRQQQNGMLLPLNGRGGGENSIDPLTIMNSIRTMTSRAANGFDQISIDLNPFIK
uniref:Uncharacterized protein n=1 Tax=Panagrolaimus sp. ES5 TaxID=591445 RepID=A0AC34G725_9BILA